MAGTKLYCLVTEAHRCEQLAQGCYAAFAPSRIWTHDLLISSSMLYPLCHCATYNRLTVMFCYSDPTHECYRNPLWTDNSWAMMTVWRIRGKIIRTNWGCNVYDSGVQWYAHMYKQFLLLTLRLETGFNKPTNQHPTAFSAFDKSTSGRVSDS